MAAFALLPVASVEIPAMADYPNHLARMALLARDGQPDANPFYRSAWALYPNLAMDLVVPPLGRAIGVEIATKLFYLAGQVLVLTGAMAFARARGRSVFLAGYAASLTLYSLPFALGFINFEFALGLALWGLAARWHVRHRASRACVHAAVVAVLFVGHLFALGLYGFTVAVVEASRLQRAGARPACAIRELALLALPAAAMGLLLLMTGGGVGGAQVGWGLPYKPVWLLGLNGFDCDVSLAITVGLLVIAAASAWEGWLRVDQDGRRLLPAFLLLFAAMPFRLFDTAFADVRVLVGAALIVPAFLECRVPPGRARTGLHASLAALTIVNAASVLSVQAAYRPDVRAMVGSFALLRPGSLVTVGRVEDPPQDVLDNPLYHMATLATHYADAQVPQLFTYVGKQPLVLKAEYADLDGHENGPVPLEQLRRVAQEGWRPDDPLFLRDWPSRSDYLYLLGPHIPNPMPELLQPMFSTGRFGLYRVRKDGGRLGAR